jgi:replicative DNA helicase
MTAAVEKLRIPPHSVEAEQSLIGAVLLDPKSWAKIANRVSTPDFFRADHRVLWDAICETLRDGLATDYVTLVDKLDRGGRVESAGGRPYIAQIVSDTPSAASIESYARIVRDYAVKRRIGECGGKVAQLMHSEDSASEALVEASKLIGELHDTARIGRGLVEVRKLVPGLLDDLDRKRAGERGLSVGLDDFDHLTFGLEAGDLVVIAARPGIGKTATLVHMADYASRSTGVAVFSAEMPAQQLLRRATAAISGIPQSRLRRPDALDFADWDAIGAATTTLTERRLWIDDTAAPSLDHLRGEVLALGTRTQLGLVMVDYVQLVTGEGANRYEQLRDVAYGLKALAKESACPIVMLAQLNRGVDGRENKRPRLADLRDSGAIEEAADIVGFLYCEGYYDREFMVPDVLECAVEKNRNGERGLCLWKFSGDTSRLRMLEDFERSHYKQLIEKQHRRRGKDEDDL